MDLAEESNSSCENAEKLIFVDCDRNDELCGEKLQSIVTYAMSVMGIESDDDPDKSSRLKSWVPSAPWSKTVDHAESKFYRYCKGLGSKLGPYQPYIRNVRLSTSMKQKIADDMKKLLPKQQPEFDIILSQAGEHVERTLEMPITDIGKLLCNSASKELILGQFVVFKIFRAGDSLEISPCLMKVKSKREQGSLFLEAFKWNNCQIEMQYEERKYVLTKFMIKQIIQRLKEKDYGF